MDMNPFINLEMVAKEEGSVFFYVTRYLIRSDLNMNSDVIEYLCLEISTKTSKIILLSLNYRPPNGDTTLFELPATKW